VSVGGEIHGQFQQWFYWNSFQDDGRGEYLVSDSVLEMGNIDVKIFEGQTPCTSNHHHHHHLRRTVVVAAGGDQSCFCFCHLCGKVYGFSCEIKRLIWVQGDDCSLLVVVAAAT